MKKLFLLFIGLLFWAGSSWGQVSNYAFASSVGFYTPLSAETILWSGTFDDQNSTAILIPEFTVDGTAYTTMFVQANGWIALGETSIASSYFPISQTTSYPVVISAFGRDLNDGGSGNPKISYNTNDGGDIVVQYQDVRRRNQVGELISFQIRLVPSTGAIKFTYGGTITGGSGIVYPEVGLRGATNSIYNNRTTTTDWAATTAGTSNDATCVYNETVLPSVGLTFTFTPPLTPPFTQTFETYPFVNWTKAEGLLSDPVTFSSTTLSGWNRDGFANVGTTGSARLNIYGDVRKEWMITPPINLGNGTTEYRLTFDLALTYFNSTGVPGTTGTDDKFAVVISTDNGASWTSANTLMLWDNAGSANVFNNISNTGENVVIDLSTYTGIVKLGFYGESTVTNADNDLFVDNVTVEEIPCPTPGELTVSDLTTTSANLGWTQNGSATLWNIKWGVSGFNPATQGTTISGVSANPYNLSDLTANTSYDWYVQANGGNGNVSNWAGPFTFKTSCNAFGLPFTEDFESMNTDFNCWSVMGNTAAQGGLSGSSLTLKTNHTWLVCTPTTFFGDEGAYIHSGVRSAALNYNATDFNWLVSSDINMPATGNVDLKFWLWYRSDELGVTKFYVNVFADEEWNTILTYNTESQTTAFDSEIIASLDAYIGKTIKVAFVYEYNNGWELAVDDISIYVPTCPAPEALTVSTLTTSSANLGWTERGSASSWNIKWGVSGFNPATGGTLISGVSANPYALSDLTENTAYDWYVQANCGDGNVSNWAGPETFITPCGPVSIPYFENFDAVTIPALPNCMSLIDDNTDDITWETDDQGMLSPNAAIIRYNTDIAMNDWLFTAGLQLEANTTYELAFFYAGYANFVEKLAVYWGSAPQVASMTRGPILDLSFGDGSWHMATATITPTSAGVYYIGFKGYSDKDQGAILIDDISIYESSCPTPGELTVTDLTTSSASLGWTENGSASSWNIKWGVSGFNPATEGTLISGVSANSYALSDLTENTAYDWYVQANCGDGNVSNWAGPETFITPCGPVSIPYFENFDAVAIPALPNCMSLIDDNTDDITWETDDQGMLSPNAAIIRYNTDIAMNDWLFTAGLQLEANTTYELAFFYAGYANFVEKLAVYWGSAPQVASMTGEPILDLSFGYGRWQKASATITPTSAGVYYIGFKGYSDKDQGAILIDDISIYVPTCPTPGELTVTDLSAGSAHLGWTENGSANLWNIKWGVSGFNPATQGTTISGVSANPYTLSDLTANTSYDWYVQADCSDGNVSNWAGPETFITACGPVSIPYFENFDAVTIPALPNCMSLIDDNTDDITWETATLGMSLPNAAIIRYNTDMDMNDWLFTAGLQLEASKTYELGFFYAANKDYVEKLAVYWGSTPQVASMTGGPILDLSFGDGSWHMATATITPTSTGVYYIGFKGYSDLDQAAILIDDIYVIEQVANATWSGTVDNNWHNAGNWVSGAIPGSTTNVVIPSLPNNYPTIRNGASCNNITLHSNASGNASLLGNTKLVVNGNATVERYISGAPEAWHLLSSPVEAQSISGDFIPEGPYGDGTGYDFYAWNEPSETWLNQKDATNALIEFIPGQGYLVAYQATNPTKVFTGNLNKWYCVIPLSIGGTSSYKWSNLIGNPYPSSIDWKSANLYKSNLVVEAGGGHNMYIYNQASNNYGVYNDANSGDGGTNGATRYIAPMQGFFVIAAEAGDFYFSEAARVHSPQSWLKSGDDNAFRLSVTAPANEGKDEILLDFAHEASQGGADKWYSMSTTAPSLYVPTVDRDYSIRFLTTTADNPIVPVAFKAGVDGEYSIQANFNTASFSSVKLMDKATGNVQDLNSNPFYAFTAATGDDANRFDIVFATLGVDKPTATDGIQVYAYGDVLYIATTSTEAALVNVYNLTGQLVMQGKTGGNTLSTFNASALSNGVYVVSVISNQGVVSQKVVIRK